MLGGKCSKATDINGYISSNPFTRYQFMTGVLTLTARINHANCPNMLYRGSYVTRRHNHGLTDFHPLEYKRVDASHLCLCRDNLWARAVMRSKHFHRMYGPLVLYNSIIVGVSSDSLLFSKTRTSNGKKKAKSTPMYYLYTYSASGLLQRDVMW